jgi:hypothetical protein
VKEELATGDDYEEEGKAANDCGGATRKDVVSEHEHGEHSGS